MSAPRATSPWLGILLLIALALHTRYKLQLGIPLDMLWACHIATLLIAISALTRLHWLAPIGLLFHLAMGIPAYLLDAFATWTTSFTSVLIHLLPALIGWRISRQHGYPINNFWRAVVFVLLSQLLAYFVTPPALNVNLVFAPWGPMAEHFPNIWVYRVFNFLLACSLLFPVHLLLKRVMRSAHP
jgi:hypothetical protein